MKAYLIIGLICIALSGLAITSLAMERVVPQSSADSRPPLEKWNEIFEKLFHGQAGELRWANIASMVEEMVRIEITDEFKDIKRRVEQNNQPINIDATNLKHYIRYERAFKSKPELRITSSSKNSLSGNLLAMLSTKRLECSESQLSKLKGFAAFLAGITTIGNKLTISVDRHYIDCWTRFKDSMMDAIGVLSDEDSKILDRVVDDMGLNEIVVKKERFASMSMDRDYPITKMFVSRVASLLNDPIALARYQNDLGLLYKATIEDPCMDIASMMTRPLAVIKSYFDRDVGRFYARDAQSLDLMKKLKFCQNVANIGFLEMVQAAVQNAILQAP